ncbi:hypothetical protein V7S43_004471 [Phytophthora oleae]|uniref:Uncharacterized protein n=1 Tax=Phytophthora oleae TaxID=2107226 RepID=A0ABD3FV23_9STRA
MQKQLQNARLHAHKEVAEIERIVAGPGMELYHKRIASPCSPYFLQGEFKRLHLKHGLNKPATSEPENPVYRAWFAVKPMD